MIARMDRLEIVCLRQRLADVVTFLQEQGAVHIEEAPLAVEEAEGFLKRIDLEPAQQREADALEDLHRTLNEVVPLLAAKPAPDAVAGAGSRIAGASHRELDEKARAWIRELRSFTRRRINIHDNIEILNTFKRSLELLQPLLGGRDVVLGENARAFVLKGDSGRTLELLSERLRSELGPEVHLVHDRLSRNTAVGIVTYPGSLNEAVGNILREERIAPMEPPTNGFKGLGIQAVLVRVNEAIARNEADATILNAQLLEYSRQTGPELMAVEARLSDRMAQLFAVNSFAESKMIGVIHGWAPSDVSGELRTALDKRFPGETLVTTLPLDEVDIRSVPTQLRNPSWLKPFEVLLTLFKPPTYGTMDPTALVAISFVLFYGFILGDVAYGLAVIAFGYVLKKKLGHLTPVNAVGTVAYWMGGSTIFFGILYGEFFGNFGERHLHMPVLWFHRGHDATTLMLYAIVIGAIHIPLSLILGIWSSARHHHMKHAAEKLALLLGLTGVGLLVLGFAGLFPFDTVFFKVLAGLCFLSMVALLVWAVGAMAPIIALEVVSLVGNVLSYCRLMALGLAGVLVADLANDLGGGLGLLLGVPLALAIHAFNIGLGMFSPTIHSLRLNYVEFLPKFYSPEGKSYQPFKKEALW